MPTQHARQPPLRGSVLPPRRLAGWLAGRLAGWHRARARLHQGDAPKGAAAQAGHVPEVLGLQVGLRGARARRRWADAG